LSSYTCIYLILSGNGHQGQTLYLIDTTECKKGKKNNNKEKQIERKSATFHDLFRENQTKSYTSMNLPLINMTI